MLRFFFFKQKTAYEMRISDWSSDVCSSDLTIGNAFICIACGSLCPRSPAMRLTFDALETLDAIEQQGSFAKAAEVLHRVPSAITYTVQKLESDLGVQLFDRSGKRAKLTDAGQALVERGRRLPREAERDRTSTRIDPS